MKMNINKKITAVLALAASASLALAACAKPAGQSGSAADANKADTLAVSASFYPVQWLAEQIGGDAVTVTSVTPANVEPHDFELSPADVSQLAKAQLVLYVAGFQPSLDDAVATVSGPRVLDLTNAVDLQPATIAHEHHHHGHDDADEHEHEADAKHADADEHADADHDADEHEHADHDHGGLGMDPHFWLDPLRMLSAGEAITSAFSTADAAHADTFTANFAALKKQLTSLDQDFSKGLQQCALSDVVTAHAAFGYLTARYGLAQFAISGIDPEAEPSPAELAEIKKVVQEKGITTIFTEELVSPKTAQALASETGAATAVLSPIESQPESGDYLSAMKTNLKELRTALKCQ